MDLRASHPNGLRPLVVAAPRPDLPAVDDAGVHDRLERRRSARRELARRRPRRIPRSALLFGPPGTAAVRAARRRLERRGPRRRGRLRGPQVVRTGATVSRTTVALTLTLLRPKRRRRLGRKLRKFREPSRAELLPPPVRRDVDRRLIAAREREHDLPSVGRDPCELVEERDHVHEDD